MKSKFEFDRARPIRICTKEEYEKYWCQPKSKLKKAQRNDDIVEVSKAEYYAIRNKDSYQTNPKETKLPKFHIVPTGIPKKKNRKPKNYIRFNFAYPSAQQYELTKADLCCFYSINASLESVRITQSFFKQELIELEKQFGRQDISKKSIQQERLSFLTHLKECRPNFGESSLHEIGDLMFNYWLQQRKQFNYPFYRPLWRAQPYEIDNFAAFRRRDKQTRSLRKTSRPVDFSTMNDLYQQFCLSAQICSKICKRQALKFNRVNNLIFEFNCICKSIQPLATCLQQADCFYSQEIQSNWQRQMKEYQADCKTKQEMEENEEFDYEPSISNFLSSVVNQADKQGLTYDLVSQFQSLQVRENENEGEGRHEHNRYFCSHDHEAAESSFARQQSNQTSQHERYYVDLPSQDKFSRLKLTDIFKDFFPQ